MQRQTGCEAELRHMTAATLDLDTEPNNICNGEAPCTSPESDFVFVIDDEKCYIDRMPNDVLLDILRLLDLKDRSKMSKVCRKFHRLLTDKSCTLEDVVVLNVFESGLWEDSIKKNTANRIIVYFAETLEQFRGILAHLKVVDSLKVWYSRTEFADAVLSAFSESAARAKCVDIYPYKKDVALEEVYSHNPDVYGVTLRPHGSDYFWKGLDLDSMPLFHGLNTLCIDSINILPSCSFPPSIQTLEYSNRNSVHFPVFLEQLRDLKNLEYLSISHAELDRINAFVQFIQTIEANMLPKLSFLFLKFCKLPTRSGPPDANKDVDLKFKDVIIPEAIEDVELKLKFIKFDLVSNLEPHVVQWFITMARSTLATISVSVILEEERDMYQLYQTAGLLKDARLSLHLAVMQKTDQSDRKNPKISAPPPELFDILVRFEASFVYDRDYLDAVCRGSLRALFEAKFIKCEALNDQHLAHLSLNCPQLKRLSIVNCESCSTDGIKHFITNISQRSTSSPLKILYKRGGSLSELYGELKKESETAEKYDRLNLTKRTFPDLHRSKGEMLEVISENKKRSLTIRTYNVEEGSHILGIVLSDEALVQNTSLHLENLSL